MKRLLWLICLLPFIISWAAEDCPEGHIESAAHNADGLVYVSTTTTIETLYGTAHKDGGDQAAANTVLDNYKLYLWWDRDKDGTADAGDEPIGHTMIQVSADDSDTTFEVQSTATFASAGFFRCQTEIIKYTGKTTESFTGCTRGYNESSAASHAQGWGATAINVWELVCDVTTDGTPYNAIGYDASGVDLDDGTEGDMVQAGALDITVVEGRAYLIKIRVTDSSGNTNNEVVGVDKFNSHGEACYLDEDGDAAQGLEDDEVLRFRVNKKPRRRFR